MINKLLVFVCLLIVSQARRARILGGNDAQPGEFPHQVSLQIYNPAESIDDFCGGSIIKEGWILTAAHCIRWFEMRTYENSKLILVARAGKHVKNITEPESEQNSLVESYFFHENYTSYPRIGPFDIALIKLTHPFHFNERVAPINLPKKNSEPTGKLMVSGWGAITDYPKKQAWPSILQKAELDIVDRATCRKALVKALAERGLVIDESIVHETNICTGSPTGGLSACDGDSGGPLISKNEDGVSELVGVASWVAKPCGRKGGPVVYVRVSSFIDWIENIISKN